jgi:hypothetical protein
VSATVTTRPAGTIKILDWRPLEKGSLRGFAKVQFGSGLQMSDVGIHVQGTKAWASPPSRPMIDRNGSVMRDETGKVRYSPVIGFFNHGTRSSWSRQIIAAMRAAHPELDLPADAGGER